MFGAPDQTSGRKHVLSVQQSQDQDGSSCFLLVYHFSCKSTLSLEVNTYAFPVWQFIAVVQSSFDFFLYGLDLSFSSVVSGPFLVLFLIDLP